MKMVRGAKALDIPGDGNCVVASAGAELLIIGGAPDARALRLAGACGVSSVAQEVIAAPAEGSPEERASQWFASALEAARGSKSGTIFFCPPGERIHPGADVHIAAYRRTYGAIFGGCSTDAAADPAVAGVPKRARYPAASRLDFTHGALVWWVGGAHVVRREAFDKAMAAREKFGGGVVGYFSALWDTGCAMKTAAPLTIGETGQLPPALAGAAEKLRGSLALDPGLWIDVSARGRQFALPYTGRNPTIERVQMRGSFYEAAELDYVRDQLTKRGGSVREGLGLDVGANTGNHALYLSELTGLSRVVVFEAAMATARWLQRSAAHNNASRIDCQHLGIAIGAGEGLASIHTGRRGHLGTAQVRRDQAGDVRVARLDDLVTEPVAFLKIDVENGELDVLAGARGLISRHAPLMLVEVLDENLRGFMAFVTEVGYRVKRAFPDEGYTNFVLDREI